MIQLLRPFPICLIDEQDLTLPLALQTTQPYWQGVVHFAHDTPGCGEPEDWMTRSPLIPDQLARS